MSFVLRAVNVRVHSVSVGFIVLPLAIEDVSVHVPELALPVCFVVLPFALVARSVGPDLDAAAVTNLASPLTFVNRPVLKTIFISILKRQVSVS